MKKFMICVMAFVAGFGVTYFMINNNEEEIVEVEYKPFEEPDESEMTKGQWIELIENTDLEDEWV